MVSSRKRVMFEDEVEEFDSIYPSTDKSEDDENDLDLDTGTSSTCVVVYWFFSFIQRS
jgi:hypothetical protein